MEAPIIAAFIGGFSALIVATVGNAFLIQLQLRKESKIALLAEKRRIYSEICALMLPNLFVMTNITFDESKKMVDYKQRRWKGADTEKLALLHSKLNIASFYADKKLAYELAYLAQFIYPLASGGEVGFYNKLEDGSHGAPDVNYSDPQAVIRDVMLEPWERALTLMKKEVGVL